MLRITLLVALALPSFAALQRVEVVERTDYLDGREFGKTGAYEVIVARVYFDADPALLQNQIIRDIALAPRNAQGKVTWSADLYVIKPRDSARGNGTALFEVSNRGGRGLTGTFNTGATNTDDAFLFEQGFMLVWLGWQWDVPKTADRLRLHAPAVSGVKGLVRAEWVPARLSTEASLGDRDMIPYAVDDPADAKMHLTVRDSPTGARTIISRAQWKLSAEKTGIVVPEGMKPGRIYELVYTASDPVVAGLGPAGIRDLVSFLKYGGNGVALLGDQRKYIKRALGFGVSQSGRFLRKFLYDGFNADEKGRKVFDGVWEHVAGAGRGSFNHRFAQPSRDGHARLNTLYPSDIFPFTDLDETDAGITDSILARATKDNVVPKIFQTNGSYEYWGRAASLVHTTPDGRQDARLFENTRIYYIAGTQHGYGQMPPAQLATTQHAANSTNARPVMRALLTGMQHWLADDKQPPASRYPLIGKDQLVARAAVAWPKVPGVPLPAETHHAYRADYGPEFAAKGIVSKEPPEVGKPFVNLVPQVDRDGNEMGGIRMPSVAVPLATLTGWNYRNAAIGAPDVIFDMIGSTFPFAKSKAEREKTGDPRPSIDERYATKDAYLGRIRASASELVVQGYLLERDAAAILERASAEWEHWTNR